MKKIIYQCSTHWDREWYRPFQGFRYYLAEMMDTLIPALETGSLPEFVFDGQTVVIEDYLDIHPEMYGRVKALIQSGKLRIGPWYVMPDEYCVSGESIVENLLTGQNVARSFGNTNQVEPWHFGYVNDIFGHIANLPQIWNGFHIDGTYLGRGVSRLPEHTFFVWKSPDGSECIAYKECYSRSKREFLAAENSDAYIRQLLARDGDLIILNYTDDHAVIDDNTFAFLDILKNTGCELFTDMEQMADFAKATENSRSVKMPIIVGELSETGHAAADFRLVTNSISSYYPLKQQNDYTEDLLCHETAPLVVLADMLGILPNKAAFYRKARQYLLKNHPHDSICGCSVDAVHNDMPFRFHQAQAIADVLHEEFLSGWKKKLSSATADSPAVFGDNVTDTVSLTLPQNSYLLTVFHPSPYDRDGIVTLDIDFPSDWKPTRNDNTGFQSVNLFGITDRNGNALPYQILQIQRGVETYQRQASVPVNRYTVAVRTTLSACGFTYLYITPESPKLSPTYQNPAGAVLENEYLQVTLTTDGALSVTDKASGRIYSRIHDFIDDGDSGNGWFYGSTAVDDGQVLSFGSSVKAEVVHNGVLVKTLRVTRKIAVPREIVGKSRSADEAELTIVTDFTLRQGEHYLECSTVIDNTAAGHRLRFLFPTGIAGEEYLSSQAFCFVRRKRGASEIGVNGREPEFTEKNTGGIIAVDGFAFVGAEGFHEAGVYPDGTVSVTGFRSVGRMFHQPNAETAKLIGKMSFHYALGFGISEPELIHLQEKLRSEPQRLPVAITPDSCAGGLTPPVGERKTATVLTKPSFPLTLPQSLLKISDRRICESILKPSENGDGVILRLYNPSDRSVDCTVSVSLPNTVISEVMLAEDNEKTCDPTMTFRPYQIRTFLIR